MNTNTTSEKKLTKQELRMKLRNKINSFKNHMPGNMQIVTEKEYKKIMQETRREMKKLQEDERVTPKMMVLYEMVKSEFTQVNIPTPVEMLNNPEETRQKLKEYFSTLIEQCKKNNVSRESFIENYLNSNYTKYHIEVLGIDIIPEKLRCNISE